MSEPLDHSAPAEEEGPPIFGSWPILYAVVLLGLAAMILVSVLITVLYS